MRELYVFYSLVVVVIYGMSKEMSILTFARGSFKT